jgi:hypothetical protein
MSLDSISSRADLLLLLLFMWLFARRILLRRDCRVEIIQPIGMVIFRNTRTLGNPSSDEAT